MLDEAIRKEHKYFSQNWTLFANLLTSRPMTITENDTLQRFLFENRGIRGELVHLAAAYRAIGDHHPYPKRVHQLLGQALAGTALLSATLKFEGSLILQSQGDGPVTLLVAQCNHHFHLRGLAKWQHNADFSDAELEGLLGKGQLGITIIPDNSAERYQGIVTLDKAELSHCLEDYFQQSEQLPTLILLTADDTRAAGLLIQQMPDDDHFAEDYWQHVLTLAKSLTVDELLNLDNQTILHRLFHEEDIRLFSAEPVCFRCRCSTEKMEKAVVSFGKDEAQDILKTHNHVVVNCEFCNRHYEFDKVDVERIFRGNQASGAST